MRTYLISLLLILPLVLNASTSEPLFTAPVEKSLAKSKLGDRGIVYKEIQDLSVYAAANGKVIYVGALADYGNIILMEHLSGKRTVYLGELVASVKKGDILNAGKQIASMGSTGNLYFEIRVNNKPLNPRSYPGRHLF